MFHQCTRCKLTLPREYLIPIYANMRGQIKQVLVCKECKKNLEIKEKKQ